jgi:hypothetical protein
MDQTTITIADHTRAKYIFIDFYQDKDDVQYYDNINDIITKIKQKEKGNKNINVFIDNKKTCIIIGLNFNDSNIFYNSFNKFEKGNFQQEYYLKREINFEQDDECDNCGGSSCQEYCVNDNWDY